MPALTHTDFLSDPEHKQFREIAGLTTDELNTLIDKKLEEAEEDICRMMPAPAWGNRFVRAIKLLTCHRLTQFRNQQAGVALAGSISSINISQGSQSVGFGGGASSVEDPEAYASTVCGQEFARLIKGLPTTGFVI